MSIQREKNCLMSAAIGFPYFIQLIDRFVLMPIICIIAMRLFSVILLGNFQVRGKNVSHSETKQQFNDQRT